VNRPKCELSLSICLLAALASLTGCAKSGSVRLSELAQACQQPRTAEIADWPERLEDFPVAALQWLAVIEEERRLESVERDCLKGL